MIKKVPKFPLKMKNGVNVRTIEELRKNADYQSIINYYLSGQLDLWCRAFGYNSLSEQLDQVNLDIVKEIYDKLEIQYDTNEIIQFLQENGGVRISSESLENDYIEEKVIDNQEIKNSLTSYINDSVNLDAFLIEVTPLNNEDGEINKYRIVIENNNIGQYYRFILPYFVSGDYTHDRFKDDLYKKISHAIIRLNTDNDYNKCKNSRYAELQKDDIFEFGIFQGEPIKWRVMDNDGEQLVCISDKVLCKKYYDDDRTLYCKGRKYWKDSSIRKWLNIDFYNNSFTSSEKLFIKKYHYNCYDDEFEDYIFFFQSSDLSFYLETDRDRATDDEYFLCDSSGEFGHKIDKKGHFMSHMVQTYNRCYPIEPCGIRPSFCLKY